MSRTIVWRTARLLISLAVVVSACGGKGPQPSALPTDLMPTSLAPATGEAERVIRLRVYAGADFRMRLLDWQEEARAVLATASGVLQQACGARLKIVEIIEWKRSGGDIGKTLESLALLDAGNEVDLVLGLIDAPEALTMQFSELSAYLPFGRHLVVRSFNQLAEREALTAELAKLSEAAQDRVLAARRRHKQSVLVANTIARLFGVEEGQQVAADAIDADRYDQEQKELSSRAAAILRITVPAYLEATSAGWQAAVEKLSKQQVSDDVLLQVKRQRVAVEATSKAVGPKPSVMREVDRKKLAEANELLAARKPVDAWARIEALLELYPGAAELMLPACQSAHMRLASDAVAHCRRATVDQPANASAWIALALSEAQAEAPGVKESLDRAAGLLEKLDDKEHRESWAQLARTYQKLSLPRAAQRAAERGGPASVLSWVFESQTRYGSSTGVSEQDEPTYLEAVKTGLKYVYASDLKRARESSASLAKDFPSSIGSPLVGCEVALRTRSYAAGLKACQQVLQLQPGNSWAHYLLGLLYGRQKKYAEATASLARAIEMDPALKAAYQTLAVIYRKSDDARLVELQREYKERFEAELK